MLEQGINIWGGEQFAPLFGSVQRFFTELASAGSQHYTMPTVTLLGDFEVEVDFTAVTSTSMQTLFGGGIPGSTETFLRLDPTDGAIDLIIGGGAFLAGSAGSYTVDNQLHRIALRRTVNDYDILLDGISVQTFNQTALTATIATVGRRNVGADYFDGIIANLKITDGTKLIDWAIDEDWVGPSTVVVNTGTLGAAGNGTAVNITSSDAENFTLHTEVSPNEWRNFDDTVIIQIAGT